MVIDGEKHWETLVREPVVVVLVCCTMLVRVGPPHTVADGPEVERMNSSRGCGGFVTSRAIWVLADQTTVSLWRGDRDEIGFVGG